MGLRYRIQRLAATASVRVLQKAGIFTSFYGPWRTFFAAWERAGIHVLPVHFYSPVPDTRSLPNALWDAVREPAGLEIEFDRALELLDRIAKFRDEYAAFPATVDAGTTGFSFDNRAFGSCDAEALYGIVRLRRPRRIVEIGCGHSTLVTLEAVARNRDEDPACDCTLTCIEPYPPDALRALPAFVELIREPVQQVPLSTFEALRAGDVLFIDSTHVAKIGSDVVYEILEVLPRLRPGVLVHLHDVFIPSEYPRPWIHEARFFWNEQYLLQAFLAFNRAFRVVWPAHMLHLRHPAALAAAFPAYDPERSAPSSFWIERCG